MSRQKPARSPSVRGQHIGNKHWIVNANAGYDDRAYLTCYQYNAGIVAVN
jgi:hypothetical protein